MRVHRGMNNHPGLETVDDDIICTEKIIADRKTFFIDLKSNARGRVVRITENQLARFLMSKRRSQSQYPKIYIHLSQFAKS